MTSPSVAGSTLMVRTEGVNLAATSALKVVQEMNRKVRMEKIAQLRSIYSDSWFNRCSERKLVKYFKTHPSNDLGIEGTSVSALLELLPMSETWAVQLSNSSWSDEISRLSDIVEVTSGHLGADTMYLSVSDAALIKKYTQAAPTWC